MESDEVRQAIETVIGGVLQGKGQAIPQFSDDAYLMRAPHDSPSAAAIGLDSLDIAQTIVQLERQLGIDPFRAAEVPVVRTLADLTACYQQALANGPAPDKS